MVSSISDWSDFDVSDSANMYGSSFVSSCALRRNDLLLLIVNFQWFIKTYLPSQTIPILRSFGTTLEAATGEYLGIRSQERKDNLLYKYAIISPFSSSFYHHFNLLLSVSLTRLKDRSWLYPDETQK